METLQFESKLICTANHEQALKHAIIIVVSSFFLAISAQITIPIQPVPITLQSFAILFIGMLFGPKMGNKIILAYLCEGICGLPVFANFSCGFHILFGPTGGYLFGFIPATALTGYLLQTGWVKHRTTIFLAALLGTIAVFIPGYFVLARFIGFHNAYLFGVTPFYIVEICKLTVLTIITPLFWRQKVIEHGHI